MLFTCYFFFFWEMSAAADASAGGDHRPVGDGTAADDRSATASAQPQLQAAATPGTGHSAQAASSSSTSGTAPAPDSTAAADGGDGTLDNTGVVAVIPPVDEQVSWREQPCETCLRPFETVPSQRLLVAAGRNQDGAIIVHEYVRCKTGEASKKRLPAGTQFRELQDARVTEKGRVVYGKSEVLDRRPRDDELMIAIADLKAGHTAPQPVWSQHPQTTTEAEDAKARRGQQALRLTPLSDPAALPMMPPGTRLLAFVSLDHSWDRSATWMVGETSWLFSLATFARSGSGTSSASLPRCGGKRRS